MPYYFIWVQIYVFPATFAIVDVIFLATFNYFDVFFCVFLVRCLYFLRNPIPETGWRDDFYVFSKGENERFQLFVHLDIDGDNGIVLGFLDDTLREVEGLGANIVETLACHFNNNIFRGSVFKDSNPYNVIKIFAEINFNCISRSVKPGFRHSDQTSFRIQFIMISV